MKKSPAPSGRSGDCEPKAASLRDKLLRQSPVIVLGLALTTRALAQVYASGSEIAALKSLSLDDLIKQEVSSVSRRDEQWMQAAAAIDVLTGQQIDRSGASNLPDALRLITGLDVAQANGRTWAISSRGFASTTANKMEVLLDGRSLYSPLYSGVFWDAQDVLLADVARIEVIRGPGAVQWGANAVNGVINIITKPAAETQGWWVGAGAGTEDRGQFAVRYGGRVGPNGYYRAYIKTWSRGALGLSNGLSAGDGLNMTQFGGRMDLPVGSDGTLLISSDAYQGWADQLTGNHISFKGVNLLSHWESSTTDSGKISAQFYYDHVERVIPRQFSEKRDTFDWQGQRELRLPHQTIVAGLHTRISKDQIGNSDTIIFQPDHRTTQLFSAFASDEIRLVENRCSVVVGSTLEHNSFTGFEVQPTARLLFTPSESMTWWTAVSRAVRTPSRIDTDLTGGSGAGTPLLLIGNSSFESEELRAAEIGWRWRPTEILWLDLSGFRNRYERLRSQEPIGALPVPFTLRNELNATTIGLEASVSCQPVKWARFKLGWRELSKSLWFDPGSRDITGGSAEGNDPRRIVTFQGSLDLSHGWLVDATFRYNSRRPAPFVPAYLEGDLRLAWRPDDRWEWGLAGRNLFKPAHREFGATGPSAELVERAITLTLTWKQ